MTGESSAATSSTRSAGGRIFGYDAFRGLAILSMIVDHLMVVTHGPQEVRDTIGRLAMPMFFLLAGHLARSPKWRHLSIALVGLVLPIFVPWIDAPNVLTLWALGVVMLWLCRWGGVPMWLPVVLALTLFANGWGQWPGSYPPSALVALMAVGSQLGRESFTWAARCPRWVGVLGSWPVTVYVGHLLILEAAALAL